MVAVLTTRRRLAAALAALALLAAACGDSQPPKPGAPGVGDGLSTTTQPGTPATTPGPGGGKPSGTTRPAGGGGGATTTPANADATAGELRAAAKGGPGQFAGMLLGPSPADDLVVDVLVQPGASVDSAAIASVRQQLASSSGKDVTLRGPTNLPASGAVHSADEIRALADAHGRSQGNGAGVVHLLYLTGSFSDDNALGVTVRADTTAIFPEQIARVASPFVSRARIERAVVTHELGHVMGLVDLYLDDGRDDPDHPGHSTNSRSVMFWAVESDLIGQVLDGPPPIDFDADDQADLRKIHLGAPAA